MIVVRSELWWQAFTWKITKWSISRPELHHKHEYFLRAKIGRGTNSTIQFSAINRERESLSHRVSFQGLLAKKGAKISTKSFIWILRGSMIDGAATVAAFIHRLSTVNFWLKAKDNYGHGSWWFYWVVNEIETFGKDFRRNSFACGSQLNVEAVLFEINGLLDWATKYSSVALAIKWNRPESTSTPSHFFWGTNIRLIPIIWISAQWH